MRRKFCTFPLTPENKAESLTSISFTAESSRPCVPLVVGFSYKFCALMAFPRYILMSFWVANMCRNLSSHDKFHFPTDKMLPFSFLENTVKMQMHQVYIYKRSAEASWFFLYTWALRYLLMKPSLCYICTVTWQALAWRFSFFSNY